MGAERSRLWGLDTHRHPDQRERTAFMTIFMIEINSKLNVFWLLSHVAWFQKHQPAKLCKLPRRQLRKYR